MNILYYDENKIGFSDMEPIAKHLNETLGYTLILPSCMSLLVDVNPEVIMTIMEQLSNILEKIKEERPEDYQRAKELSTVETYRRIIERKNLK